MARRYKMACSKKGSVYFIPGQQTSGQQTCYFMPGRRDSKRRDNGIGINVKTLSLAVLTPNVSGTLALSMMLLATLGDSTD